MIGRLLGIVTTLSWIRAMRDFQALVRRHAPEGASSIDVQRAALQVPEVRAAQKRVHREMLYVILWDAVLVAVVLAVVLLR